ncbi:MAG: hypothetical protein HY563_04085 [Ignavibacteriales bacterium]|nr:hypothetical protein [Ignavibacteriales bacterium]
MIQYRYNSAVGFELGASAFIPGEIMRARFGGAAVGFWGYLAASVSF